MQIAKYVWMDGEFVANSKALIHINTHTLHYGTGVFEGISAYDTANGIAVFRLNDHVRRLFESAHIAGLKRGLGFTEDDIKNAILDGIKLNTESGLKANNDGALYIRPLIYKGSEALGVGSTKNSVHVSISFFVWGSYLGHSAIEHGVSAMISSYTRHHPNIMPIHAKTCGNYVNGTIAKNEATARGFHEPILLDPDGFVAEGSGANIFMVRKDRSDNNRPILITTPKATVLEGITRDCVIEIARRNLCIRIIEERFTRDQLYIAEEVFLCGTATEITPVCSIDDGAIGPIVYVEKTLTLRHRDVTSTDELTKKRITHDDKRTIEWGRPGTITKLIQSAYFNAVHGRTEAYAKWLTYV